MPTLIYACGCECGVTGTGTHYPFPAGNAPTFSTTTVRTGSRSRRYQATANDSYDNISPHVTTTRRIIARFYMRWATLPNNDAQIFSISRLFGDAAGVAVKTSDSTIRAFNNSNGGAQTLGTDSFAITTGVWYRIDVKIDTSANPWTVDIQVDGTALTQHTAAYSANDASFVNIGGCLGDSPATGTFDCFMDDLVMSQTTADYPIGAGTVEALSLTSDGTHNLPATANYFERGNTGTDIANSDTNVFNLVDDVPLPTSLDEADCVRIVAAAPTNTHYVEFNFSNPSATSVAQLLDAIVVNHELGTGTCVRIIKLVDSVNTTEDNIYSNSGAGATAIRYTRKAYTAMPGGANALNNTNINGLKLRFGFSSDASPNVAFDAAMVEAAFASGVTHSAAAVLAALATLAADATNTKVAAAALAASATVSPLAKLTAAGAAALAASATVSPAGMLTAGGAATLAAVGTIAGVAIVTHNATTALAAVATINPDAASYKNADAALAASATISPAGKVTYAGAAALNVAVTLGPTAIVTHNADTVLSTSASLAAAATNTKVAQAALAAAATLAAASGLSLQAVAALAASAVMSPTAQATYGGAAGLTGSATLSPAAKATYAAVALLAGVTTLAPNGGLKLTATAALASAVTLNAIGTLRTIPNEQRVWAVLYDSSDVATALWPYIIKGKTTEAVNAIGVWQITVPANQDMADLMSYGRRVDLYYEPEGSTPIMRGRIRSWEMKDSDDGPTFDIVGWSLGVELLWASAGYAIYSVNDTASNVMTNIVARTQNTWTRLISGSGFVNFSNDYPMTNAWRASLLTAQIQGGYLRETTTARQLELKRGTTASGLRLRNAEQQLMNESDYDGIINGLPSIKKDGSDIVNRIYPFGQGLGGELFNLQRSTRSSPYTITTEQGPTPRLVDNVLTTVVTKEGFSTNFIAEGENRYCLAYIVADGAASTDLASIGGQQMENSGAGLPVTAAGVTIESDIWSGKPPKGNPQIKMDAPVSGPSVALIASFKGVDQVDPVREFAGSAHTGTTSSISVNSEVGDYIYAWICFRRVQAAGEPTITPGTGVSLIEQFNSAGYSVNQLTSWTKKAAAGNTTLSWTFSSSVAGYERDLYAVSLKPQNLYYIEDSTSVTANRRRSKSMVMNALRAADPTDMVSAANTLYDRAVTEMLASKDGIKDYNFDVTDLPTPTTWLVGDSIKTYYAGRAIGDEQSLLISGEDLICLERTRQFSIGMPMKWNLKMTNVYRFPQGLVEVLYGNDERLSDLER